MEPFRPLVDLIVHDLLESGQSGVTKETKPELARILVTDMSGAEGISPVSICLGRLAVSLAQCFAGTRKKLEVPRRTLPLEG